MRTLKIERMPRPSRGGSLKQKVENLPWCRPLRWNEVLLFDPLTQEAPGNAKEKNHFTTSECDE